MVNYCNMACRLVRITSGCLLAVAATGAVVLRYPAVAQANTCSSSHANVEGFDAGPLGTYGNKGYIYINTQATLGATHDAVWRSLFVVSDAGDWVEFGWTEQRQAGIDSPTPAADWSIDGQPTPGAMTFNHALAYNSDVRFRIENIGTSDIFRFVIADESSPLGYSPALQFGSGFPLTNSEHYNTCDSMWTHMYDLAYELPEGTWNSGYQDLKQDCSLAFKGDGWLLDKISNSELQVNQTSGTQC
jgi:hypothetical protein